MSRSNKGSLRFPSVFDTRLANECRQFDCMQCAWLLAYKQAILYRALFCLCCSAHKRHHEVALSSSISVGYRLLFHRSWGNQKTRYCRFFVFVVLGIVSFPNLSLVISANHQVDQNARLTIPELSRMYGRRRRMKRHAPVQGAVPAGEKKLMRSRLGRPGRLNTQNFCKLLCDSWIWTKLNCVYVHLSWQCTSTLYCTYSKYTSASISFSDISGKVPR